MLAPDVATTAIGKRCSQRNVCQAERPAQRIASSKASALSADAAGFEKDVIGRVLAAPRRRHMKSASSGTNADKKLVKKQTSIQKFKKGKRGCDKSARKGSASRKVQR